MQYFSLFGIANANIVSFTVATFQIGGWSLKKMLNMSSKQTQRICLDGMGYAMDGRRMLRCLSIPILLFFLRNEFRTHNGL